MTRMLTKAQKRALMYLQPGKEHGDVERSISSALASVSLYHRDLVMSEWRRTPRGRSYLAYWLTPLGVDVRSQL